MIPRTLVALLLLASAAPLAAFTAGIENFPQVSPDDPAVAALGTDADGDGLWDDVRAGLDELREVPESPADDGAYRETLEQGARALQWALVAVVAEPGASADRLPSAARALARAINCLGLVSDDPREALTWLEGLVVSTPERAEAHVRFNSAVGDLVTESLEREPCEP